MAIPKFVNNIYEGFQSNEYTIGIFLELKKAFDTVNHQILIDKLNFYGSHGIPLAWLTSYLDNNSILWSMVMLLLILLYVGSLKALFLALYYFSFTLVIFSFLQTIFHLFSFLMTLIFFFITETPPRLMPTSWLFILINPSSSSSIHNVIRSILQN